VVIRDAAEGDGPALRRLAEASVVYAGDMVLSEDGELCEGACGLTDGLRVAEDDVGPVGVYGLVVRRVPSGVDGALTGMLVARRARRWAVDQLLVADLQYRASRLGAHEVTVLARPPMDAFFRHLGARAVGLAAPWGPITWPRLQLELPV
jgi:hypothetical protein